VPNTPGSLYHALGEFATRSVNMTKLESRPRRNRPWQYVFYVDLDGHWQDPAHQRRHRGQPAQPRRVCQAAGQLSGGTAAGDESNNLAVSTAGRRSCCKYEQLLSD
jgi:hypothetical protein